MIYSRWRSGFTQDAAKFIFQTCKLYYYFSNFCSCVLFPLIGSFSCIFVLLIFISSTLIIFSNCTLINLDSPAQLPSQWALYLAGGLNCCHRLLRPFISNADQYPNPQSQYILASGYLLTFSAPEVKETVSHLAIRASSVNFGTTFYFHCSLIIGTHHVRIGHELSIKSLHYDINVLYTVSSNDMFQIISNSLSI